MSDKYFVFSTRLPATDIHLSLRQNLSIFPQNYFILKIN